jgi:hypothetical protein
LLYLTESLNPRKIKRVINIFKLLKNLINNTDVQLDLLLFEISIIYEKDVSIYNELKEKVIYNKIDEINLSTGIKEFSNIVDTTLNSYIIRKDKILCEIFNIF